jgi:type IV pilus assembly protein PilO
MNLSDISLDFDNVGSWPLPVKAAAVLLASALTAGLIYYLDTQSQLVELDAFQAKEQELKATFETKQKKAVNLEEYKQQLDEIEKSFGDLLRQLPDKTQVPDLLVDVSQTGLASGLEFELFKPGNETPKEFYAELPIDIRVLGSYTEFGTFISGLASLPRIVTIHNVKIAPRKESSTGNKNKPLVMEALVKTYRYMDEATPQPSQDKKNKSKRP